jgi:branched-chain amino acid aminotransferase/4-amino-4-deoxychorismate lyase
MIGDDGYDVPEPVHGVEETDRGFTLGDGLFETLLIEDGVVRHAEKHWERLIAGCDVLGLPAFDGHTGTAIFLTEPGRWALRVNWSAGVGGRGLDRPENPAPRMTVSVAPAPLPGPSRLVTARSVRRNEMSPASRLKTLSYLDNVLAREEARAAGGDEAVMLNTKGQLACAAAANLFWVRDGRVFTPALECGVRAGITRARLMAAHPVEEVVAIREDLDAAEAIFLTNSLAGVRAVCALDGLVLPPHPLVAALAAKLSA